MRPGGFSITLLSCPDLARHNRARATGLMCLHLLNSLSAMAWKDLMRTIKSLRPLVGRPSTLLLVLSLALLLLTGFAQSDAPAVPGEEEAIAQFEAELERLRQEMLILGMSAAVVQDQELLWAKGFGYADPARGIVATADTPYHLASVTKPIAATVLMQLVEQGALNLDDPAASYGVHVESLGEVNIWHLLTHTSQGMPGLVHNYDGGLYALLDRVMIGATGKPFGQLLNERILTPLEMSHTAPNPTWGWKGYWASLGLGRDTDQYPDVYRDLAAPYQLDPEYNNVPGAYSLHFSPAAGLSIWPSHPSGRPKLEPAGSAEARPVLDS